MLKVFKYLRWYHWILMLVAIALVYTQVSADLEMPGYLTQILNNAGYISTMQAAGLPVDSSLLEEANQAIWVAGRQMLICAIISVSATLATSFISARIAAGFSHDLRKTLYQKIQKFSLTEIDEFSTASLITRTTNDVTQVQMVIIMGLRIAVSAPLTAIRGISEAVDLASVGSLNNIVIIGVICLVILVISNFLIVIPQFKIMQANTDKLNLVTRENLTGIRVVRANNAQDLEEEKFAHINDKITKTNLFTNRVMSLMSPGMMIIMNMTSLAIVWVGSYAINDKSVLIGDVFGFQQYTMMICMAFMQLTMVFIMAPRGQVSATRINEILDSKNLIVDPKISNKGSEEGTVEFKNVTFSYSKGEEAVLEDISFKVNRGETFAIIGSTGSGKTTILNLISRFYDVTSGQVLVDGVDVREISQYDLHEKIALVPQKSSLFIGTIKSNLEYGLKNPTDEDITRALQVSQSYDFVSKLDEGVLSPVSQGGTNFSGGQRQRLCIARAIIKKANIYLYDDSFSALDLKTDKALREALKNDSHNSTNIIVAQRIGTIIDADKILVLDDGKVVGYGTHKELLENCVVYQEIAYSQLSKEELENA